MWSASRTPPVSAAQDPIAVAPAPTSPPCPERGFRPIITLARGSCSWSVTPRPRNYTERLCNPRAMLHNRRAWNYRSHATHRSCHKHWHSYQCIIRRSRLVEQLAHHRLYDTKTSYSNSYMRKMQITHKRGHRPHSTSGGSEVVLSSTTRPKYRA